MKFDGIDKETLRKKKFKELGRFQRFFTESGEGYAKHGYNQCVNDYSLKIIIIDPDSEVYVK